MHILISTYSQLTYGISVEFRRRTKLIARKGNLEFNNSCTHSCFFITTSQTYVKQNNKAFFLHKFDIYDIYDICDIYIIEKSYAGRCVDDNLLHCWYRNREKSDSGKNTLRQQGNLKYVLVKYHWHYNRRLHFSSVGQEPPTKLARKLFLARFKEGNTERN